MSTLREAAQQALEALDSDNPDIQLRAATALRAALSQPVQEPVAWLRVIDEAMVTHHLGVADPADDYEAAKSKMNSLLCCAQDIGAYFASAHQQPAPEPVQEPVAWMVYTQDGASAYVTDNPADIGEDQRALPLYAAPPVRHPLAQLKGGGNLPPPLQGSTVAETATTQQPVEQTPPSEYRRGYWDGFAIGKREGRIEAEDALSQPVQEPVQPMRFKVTVVDNAHPNGIPLEQWVRRDQTAALRADAERYRYLLGHARRIDVAGWSISHMEQLSPRIDAAREES